LLVDTKAGYAFRANPQGQVEDLVLEGSKNVHLRRHRRLAGKIRADPRPPWSCPFAQDLYREICVPASPRVCVLYGPPGCGCGKTLIAKARQLAGKKSAKVSGDDAREAKSLRTSRGPS